ncbi:hypothetical protein C3L33_18280, partial [Rhododendron williamsianum]
INFKRKERNRRGRTVEEKIEANAQMNHSALIPTSSTHLPLPPLHSTAPTRSQFELLNPHGTGEACAHS